VGQQPEHTPPTVVAVESMTRGIRVVALAGRIVEPAAVGPGEWLK
jgi:hypothetical protein